MIYKLLSNRFIKKVVLENPLGFTLNLKGKLLKSGYSVSFTNRINFKDLDKNIYELKKMLRYSFNQMGFKVKIGGWLENDVYYLDLSLIFNTKKKALDYAKTFNQKGIFNISKTKFIENKQYVKNSYS